jgi:Na+:H+ antiporter, NhaA family
MPKGVQLFNEFFRSEKASGIILLICTAASLLLANIVFGNSYINLWEKSFSFITIPLSPTTFINDGLMTLFFLLVGLEIEREIYIGELSQPKKALLPVIAALGGSLVPPMIHFTLNHGLPSQPGAGIPMATDIAFAIGILSLVGKSVPFSLKVFLTALAIIDDLFAIITISIFYSDSLSFYYLLSALLLFIGLCVLNRCGINRIWVYLLGGAVLWFLMHLSGIHATITGVLLAFALPFRDGKETSPSYKVQHALHYPVAFFIMPLFALANTGIIINHQLTSEIISLNGAGIIAGLFFGKVIGIASSVMVSHKLKITKIPADWTISHIIGAGFLGGIGFTMSIFISILAFNGNDGIINSSKIAVLIGSLMSGIIGYSILKISGNSLKRIKH